ncbi:MAG: hypothetical protein DRP62_02605 [Planctomycetota bacterium]|nr:MAG: hypothetical protein DRP62_02605 [Planctomycetota bacterium]
MQKATGRILKSDDIKLDGQFHLDIGRVGPSPAKEKNTALTAPQAHIVESHPEFTTIEVTCSCGTKTYIRCEYADSQSDVSEAGQTKINGENDNAN